MQVDSLDEAGKRIDMLAAKGEVDPAFLLTMAKAYSGVKETDFAKDEVKDIMYYLYMKVRASRLRLSARLLLPDVLGWAFGSLSGQIESKLLHSFQSDSNMHLHERQAFSCFCDSEKMYFCS